MRSFFGLDQNNSGLSTLSAFHCFLVLSSVGLFRAMSEPTTFVVAGVQCDPQIARPDHNLEMIADWLAQARKAGASLAIFPECSVPGYCFDSLEEGLAIAETVPGPATEV